MSDRKWEQVRSEDLRTTEILPDSSGKDAEHVCWERDSLDTTGCDGAVMKSEDSLLYPDVKWEDGGGRNVGYKRDRDPLMFPPSGVPGPITRSSN